MSKSTYIVNHNQNLVDLAIEHYGDAGAVFQLLEDNPALTGPDQVLNANDQLLIDDQLATTREQTAFGMIHLVTNPQESEKTRITVSEGQSLTDLVIDYYGDLSYIFQLLEDNPQIQSPESTLVAGDKIWIRKSVSEKQKENQFGFIDVFRNASETNRNNAVTYEGQSVLDLALQEYGDIAAAFDLLQDLNTDNIGALAPPDPGTPLSIRKNRVYDAEVTNYYQNRNIRVNTGKGIIIEGIGLCSSDGVLLISFDNFILKASDL